MDPDDRILITRAMIVPYMLEVTYAEVQCSSSMRQLQDVLAVEEQTGHSWHANVFGALQGVLVAASSVYWLLTADLHTKSPLRVRQFSTTRAAYMRAAIGEPAGGLSERNVRNGMEHIAARLDEYLVGDPKTFVDHVIVETAGGPIVATPDGDAASIRYLEMDTLKVRLLNYETNLREIQVAIETHSKRAKQWLSANMGLRMGEVIA